MISRCKYELASVSYQLFDIVGLDLIVLDRSSFCLNSSSCGIFSPSYSPFASEPSGSHHSLPDLGCSEGILF